MNPEIAELLLASGIVGFIASLITCIVIIYKYKKKLKAPIYPIDKYAQLSLSDSSDNYLTTTVTRVRVASSKRND